MLLKSNNWRIVINGKSSSKELQGDNNVKISRLQFHLELDQLQMGLAIWLTLCTSSSQEIFVVLHEFLTLLDSQILVSESFYIRLVAVLGSPLLAN